MGRAHEVRAASMAKTAAIKSKQNAKFSKAIYIAAKSGLPDPDMNLSLKKEIEKAKKAHIPADVIKKAIEKAKGGTGEAYTPVRYEGFGPENCMVIVDCLTDNRNRTASAVRSTFTKRGGNLGTDGSVSYMFERKGIIVIPNTYSEDDIMTIALENDALDFTTNDDSYEISTSPEDFVKMNKALEDFGVSDFIMNEVRFVPSNYISLDEDKATKIMGLVDALEELDDVSDVYHNLEID